MTVKTKNISRQQPVRKLKAEDSSATAPQRQNTHLKTAARRAYASQKDRTIENEQITQFLPMVHKIVQKVVTYLKPPLSYEDMVSAGTVGLVKAARDYDPSYQAEFKTYAYIRIKGAILDELRDWSFVPASVNKQIQKAMKASLQFSEQTGAAPTDEQLADKLEISVDKLYKTLESARAKQFFSIDSTSEDLPPLALALAATNETTPDKRLEQTEFTDKLIEAIQQLNEKQRQTILLYYQQELTMKQIAKVFNITEPRVSQVHANALFNLSVKLRQWKNGRY